MSASDKTNPLTHFDHDGRVNMVDVSAKTDTVRTAIASGHIVMSQAVLDLAVSGQAQKGDVMGIAEIAGIMAAKKTSDLIPLCHPLPLSGAKIEITTDANLPGLRVKARVKTTGKTGVEMEALTAVSVALLTIYDMLKAADKSMVMGAVQLEHKTGGKSGEFKRTQS